MGAAMTYATVLRGCFLLLCLAMLGRAAQKPVYVVLWFDTEDYIDPIADDAALRLASDLTSLAVEGTFKIVGEKARVLERRGRTDVIQALRKHCVGYHSDWHSMQPAPAVNLQFFGLHEGADEFERRQRTGLADVARIFGVNPVCYGQPGSSWAPQANLALRRMGIRVYLDEGIQVGYHDQPVWYGGLLYVYSMGPYQVRADIDHEMPDAERYRQFDAAVARLQAAGGGVISTMYHPTELVHTEFWDAVNFSHGVMRERSKWELPERRSADDAERCFRIVKAYVAHAQAMPGVRFVTASELLQLYADPEPPLVEKKELARHFQRGITFLSTAAGDLSAADILVQMLGLPPQYVDGPERPGMTNYLEQTIPDFVFDASVNDVKSFITANHSLPSEVFVGAKSMSLADFAATLAEHLLSPGPVRIMQGKLAFEQYFSNDAAAAFRWPIHPDGFAPNELLDLARLQGWTLKPARLR